MISYEPLWKTMKVKNISQYYLLQNGIDNKMLDYLRNNRNIMMRSLEKLCNILECGPEDIVEFLPDEKK